MHQFTRNQPPLVKPKLQVRHIKSNNYYDILDND